MVESVHGLGHPDRELSSDEVSSVVHSALSEWDLAGRRVLVIVPDGTRSGPLPRLFRLICAELCTVVQKLDFLIALGTHRPMSQQQIDKHLGTSVAERDSLGVGAYNHEWWDPAMLMSLGTISAGEVERISGGRLRREVDVRVNRRLTEYDRVIICGPVFPHEVVGFSGGNKYFFPGVSGPEVIDLSHWLGALITNYEMIGKLGVTPVRRLIDLAASLVPARRSCLAMVVASETEQLRGLFAGTPEDAWAAAAELSAQVNMRYVDAPFRKVLSVMPESYEDIWTAGKGMYKAEPVVADGGEIVIYAPHITEFSYSHGNKLAEIGYHVRDYFTKQPTRFQNYSGTVLAHSTHVKGTGTYDETTGEHPRVRVTLATGISEKRCVEHNLGYQDPRSVDVDAWSDRQREDILMLPKAGEVLYRLRSE